MTQTDLDGHLTVKGTLYTRNTCTCTLKGQISVPFTLRPAEWEKSEMHRSPQTDVEPLKVKSTPYMLGR